MSRNPKRLGILSTVIITLLILAIIAATAFVIWLCIDLVNQEVTPSTSDGTISLPTADTTLAETQPPETTEPEPVPEHVVATATIGSMGDLLMHLPVVDTGKQSDGSYNFDSIFKYVKEYASAMDYAAINLETTLYGTGKAYSGFPMFNSPDAIVDGARNAGFDLMLTANNHSYDTGITGYTRTLEVCRDAGFDTLGTMASADEPKYQIKDINGIQIGMICYTYETSNGTGSYPSLNGNPMYDGSYDIVNCFRASDTQSFYTEVEGYLKEMKAAGAEATMIYMHWGVEYQTYANDSQKAMAQKLCDLGFDVIIGGHPHVVQPVDLLESTVDSDHKTVIIYSMGNAVSNQRQGYSDSFAGGYTEDGTMFQVTFEKYSDGTVYLAEADVLPTWVNMDTRTSKKEYNILPLDNDRQDEWMTMFDLNDTMLSSARNSYQRTMKIVGEGLEECQTWLAQAKEDREEYYYNLAYFPEMFATEATEPVEETEPTETVPEESKAAATASAPAQTASPAVSQTNSSTSQSGTGSSQTGSGNSQSNAETCSHSYIYLSPTIGRNPGCTGPGWSNYICTLCQTVTSKEDPERRPPLGHDFAYAEVIAPTATEQGYTLTSCTRCGLINKSNFVDPIAPETVPEASTEAA